MMKIGRINNAESTTNVTVITADSGFAELVRTTFGASPQIMLRVVAGALADIEADFDPESATVAVIDLDTGRADEMRALERLMTRVGSWLPVVAVTQAFDAAV